MYNLISLLWFILIIGIFILTERVGRSELLLKLLSMAVLLNRLVFYIYQNIKFGFTIPVEISSISYFLLCYIMLFNKQKLYIVGAFYGIVAGLGYYVFYILLGFTLSASFSVLDIVMGCINHGYLLIAGLFLFKHNTFSEIDKPKIWITIFSLLCWALVFYDLGIRGITFVYYIIKPQFLFIFKSMIINSFIIALYYALLIVLFNLLIKLFFKLNCKLSAQYQAIA